MVMELYVSGFNAWGQLCFNDFFPNGQNGTEDAETDDIPTFTLALRENGICRVRPFLSYTTVICDGQDQITAGYVPSEHSNLRSKDPRAYETLAEASNGMVAYIDKAGVVHQFSSLHDALTSNGSGQTFPDLPACKQLIAYETGFMALTLQGDGYTWGDERYGACLGRDHSSSEQNEPADKPGLILALQDLPTGPIKKIAAGGYTLAAVTEGNDLYIWGGHPGRETYPADLTEEPTPVEVGEEDIADFAVGESHILILTISGRVLGIGVNGNGQLGSPGPLVDSWAAVGMHLPTGSKIVQVAAGPRNSFIVVGRDEASSDS